MAATLGGLQVSLLGPVEITASGGPQTGIRQQGLRALLALLALRVNRVVSPATLIDGLWQEEPSRHRELNLHARISQLRKHLSALEPGRAGSRIATHERGYQLILQPGELDLTQFIALAERGRQAGRGGAPGAAAELMREALGLWRGPALSDVVGSSDWLAREASGLEERRLGVYAEYGDAMLAAGRPAEVIGELAVVVAEQPWRERLRWQLMLAYYRSGRQAEALACYAEGAQILSRELGVRPGADLQDLHRRILRADPALSLPPAGPALAVRSGADVPSAGPGQAGPEPARGRVPGPGAPPVIPRQLPAGVRHFAGRLAELSQLDAQLGAGLPGPAEPAGPARPAAPVLVTAIGGTGGVGKTALALHWAHRVASRFPDGQLHVNLRGYDPAGEPVSPAAAIRGFLDALGIPAGQVPGSADAQAALYRSVLTGRRMLILLDNARDAAQVRPLLPGTPGSLVLVTSRSALAGLITADGAVPVPLGLVSQAEALELLTARLGPARLAADPAAASHLIELCGRLPLALAIVAARAAAAPALPLAALVAELRGDRLGALDSSDPASSVRAVFSWSLSQLSPDAAGLFRVLGLHPGAEITWPAAASMAGLPLPRARRLISELVNASLLTEQKPGRFTFHDLLRAYAAEQAGSVLPDGGRRAAIRRLLDHYLYTAGPAGVLLLGRHELPQPALPGLTGAGVTPEQPGSRPEAIAWFSAELDTLAAVAAFAGANGCDDHAWQIPCTATEYFRAVAANREWARMNRTALAAAERLGSAAALGRVEFSIGTYYRITGAFPAAVASLTRAMDQFAGAGDLLAQAATHAAITRVHLSVRSVRPDGAVPGHDRESAIFHAGQALAIYQRLGDAAGEGRILLELADYYLGLGELQAAKEHCDRAIGLVATASDQLAVILATGLLGQIHFGLGQYQQAVASYLEALRGNAAAGIEMRPPHLLENLGDAYLAAGDPGAAEAAWRQVIDLGQRQERQNEIPTWRRARVLAKIDHLAAGRPLPDHAGSDHPDGPPGRQQRQDAPQQLAVGIVPGQLQRVADTGRLAGIDQVDERLQGRDRADVGDPAIGRAPAGRVVPAGE
jgi:DNA-binding SARP family transcriptional activator